MTPRFTVFARPAADGRTPEFVVMDHNVCVSRPFKTHAEAVNDRDQRDFAASSFKRAEWDYAESIR